MNFLHIPGQGLGVLLIRIFIKTEIRSFWVRTPKLRMSTRIAIIAGSTTGSITESVGIEEHALLTFSEHLLDAGGPCLGFSNSACSVAQLRMSTRIAIIAGSTTGSITESLGAEENALLFKIKNILLSSVFYHLRFCLSAINRRMNYAIFRNLSRNAWPTIKSLFSRCRVLWPSSFLGREMKKEQPCSIRLL